MIGDRKLCLSLLFSFCALAGRFARAEDEAARSFAITPFVGLRGGGNFHLDAASGQPHLDAAASFALALNLRIDAESQYELFYDRQSTTIGGGSPLSGIDVDVEYLHLGGTTEWRDPHHRIVPYIVGGLGATRFHPKAAQTDDDTRFSLSLGAGLRVPFGERLSLRLEGRGYLTWIDARTAFFCRSDASGALCRVHGNGSVFAQYELLAGAALAF